MWNVASLTRRVKIAFFVVLLLAGLVAQPRPAKAFFDELAAINQLQILIDGLMWFFAGCSRNETGGVECDPLSYGKASAKGIESQHVSFVGGPTIPLTSNLMLGVMAGIGRNDATWRQFENTQLRTDMNIAGAFLAWAPTHDTMVVVSGGTVKSDNRLTGFGTSARFDSNAWNVAANVSRRFNMGAWYVTPSVGVAHSRIERDSFFDAVFGEFTPGSEIGLSRFSTGVEFGVPLPCANGPASAPKMDTKAPGRPAASCGRVFASLTGFHDRFTGIVDTDPTVPELRDRYFGAQAAVGFAIPLARYVNAGGRVMAFNAGDVNGWGVQGYITVDLWELLGGKPLFAR